MFKPEQKTRSVPSGNKTINCALHIDELNERFDDMLKDDIVQVFWPAKDLVECCHGMSMEPIVSNVIECQNTVTADGLLNVVTNFNNLAIPKTVIEEHAAMPVFTSGARITPEQQVFIDEYNEGMWHGEKYGKPDLVQHITADEIKAGVQTDSVIKKLKYLVACKRSDNCNKWIQSRYQFMGVMSTEAMFEKDRTRASQKCASWMGGVCDVWHNNIKLDKMIEVGN